jgi:AraC-like DNA-binding protein
MALGWAALRQYASPMRAVAAIPFAPVQPGLGAAGPHGLSYREVSPPADLAADLVSFWEIAAPARLSTPFSYRIAPDGCVDLVFDVAGGGAWLFGARLAPFAVELAGDVALFGIRVRPGRLERVLAHPAGTIAGGSFVLDDVLGGSTARSLELRLAEQPSLAARARVAAAALRGGRRLRTSAAPGRAVADAIVAGGGAVRVAALAGAHGLSPRHLQRLCFSATGLTPKQLGRVVRFQRALACLTSGAAPSLAALAAELGYFDQAHLSGEIRTLLGTTPGALLRAHTRSDFSNPRPQAQR